jgi:small subunit ribosomal protein S2
MIDFRELIRLGAHFGHIKSRLHPKMQRYVWGVKNNVNLIDVSKTAQQVGVAAQFLESVAKDGKNILWVGTKKAAQDAVFEAAGLTKAAYVNHRWVGGTLSNFSQVKKSVTKLLHYEDILSKADKNPFYTKKEMNSFNKMVDRLEKNIGGIKTLTWPVGAIVLVDVMKERSALHEAAAIGVPVVALVDTNSDPSLVNYVIPVNDDSARVIKVVVDYLAQAVVRGQAQAQAADKKRREEEAEKKASKLKAEGTTAEGEAAAKKRIEKKPTPTVRPVGTVRPVVAKKKVEPVVTPAEKKA